jgi:hypothetical protein
LEIIGTGVKSRLSSAPSFRQLLAQLPLDAPVGRDASMAALTPFF